MMNDREFSVQVVQRLRNAGFEAYWAGGCVRDELLGLSPDDYDVATNAVPEQVQALFRRSIAVGASFGVIEVLGPRIGDDHLKVQVATFRSDGPYGDGRRPSIVHFSTAFEDAQRRDFTINGMFFDPLTHTLLDYVGGRVDLDARILRAIGDPVARFREDKLRLLRAVRFAARYSLTLDPATDHAIRQMASELTVVSAERIAEELRKMLVHRHRGRGLQLMHDAGLLHVVLPEIVESPDRWQRTLTLVSHLPISADFPLVFASILYESEIAEEKVIASIADRLKLANAERHRIGWLTAHRQSLIDAPTLRPSKLKVLLAQPGIDDLLALHQAAALARDSSTAHVDFCFQRRAEWLAQGQLDPAPLITGDDLKRLGFRPGPDFKRWLDAAREAQLDGTIQSFDDALKLIQDLGATPAG